ncbi:PQQ-dependent sugar dehydrogenase [Sphingomonas antarctica]|uniref:PQQ-dependent sugar dehydrogenase n=1 Tax=Sphingomonas antarctica TaxID=2040274 RepID=UPI0039E93306
MLPISVVALAACTAAAPVSNDGRANLTPVQPPFHQQELAKFDAPFAMAFLPGGAVLVTEKAGHVKLRMPDGGITDVAGVPAVASGGQGGLLDVAIAPDFAQSGMIYLSYAEGSPDNSQLALARATLVQHQVQCIRAPCPPQAMLAGLTVIWRSGSAGKGGQFGANIAFAPDGKSLFLSSGERQRFIPAQDPDQALGKIMHLTLDGKPAAGNPWAGKIAPATVAVIDPPKNTGLAASAPARQAAGHPTTPAETWSTGHRNPYGLAFDSAGRLWEVEMGPKGGDEVNLITRGGNYGWPKASNGDNYDGSAIPAHKVGDGFMAPKAWWNPSISPGGMMIYSGAMWPAWRGSMFVAALSGEALIRVELSGDTARAAEQFAMDTRIRDVAQAPDGAIWVLEDGEKGSGGRLIRLSAN